MTKPMAPLLIVPETNSRQPLLKAQRVACVVKLLSLTDKALDNFTGSDLYAPYSALLMSQIQHEGLDASETAARDALLLGFRQNSNNAAAARNLLGALLYVRPGALPSEVQLAQLPESCAADFLRYLFLPWYFIEAGEVERHADVIQTIVRQLHDGLEAHSNSPRWQKLGLAFFHHANFVPLYFSRRNLKDIYVLRARIMEHVLRACGFQVDHVCPPRAPGSRIRLGIVLNSLARVPETYLEPLTK